MNDWLPFCDCPAPAGGFSSALGLALALGLFMLGHWLWWKFAMKGWLNMTLMMKIFAVVVLMFAVGLVVAMKDLGEKDPGDASAIDASNGGPLPRLVSLGGGKCIPCVMMDPIRKELRAEYANRLQVVYHDVGQEREAGEQYGIRIIPTLIYFDAQGKELGRTEGFQTKQQIITSFAKWGVDLNQAVTGNDAKALSTSDVSTPAEYQVQFAAATATQSTTSEQAMLLGEAYPLLGDGPLAKARLTSLPEGQLMQAGDVIIQATDVKAMVDDAPPNMQPRLKRNQLYLLEQLATQRLVTAKAKSALVKKPGEKVTDQEAIQRYLQSVAAGVKVSDPEILQFYQSNSAMLGGAPLAEVKEQIMQYLLGQAQQTHVDQHIQTLVHQADIQLDEQWTKAQVQTALDNPVDRIRAGGQPSMIDFGSHGCGPCDMMTPILERLAKSYVGRAEILFVPVAEHQILAARFGVQGIPTQIFFDAQGREVFRHTGFLSQDKIEAQLAQMGVR